MRKSGGKKRRYARNGIIKSERKTIKFAHTWPGAFNGASRVALAVAG